MDGLLLDTEDLYTLCINEVLARYSRPPLPWSIKAKLQGRPAAQATAIFRAWARLPISHEQYAVEVAELHRLHFPTAGPLPGVEDLLAGLMRTRYWDLPESRSESVRGHRVHLCLATSSHTANFHLKTSHLPPHIINHPFPAPHNRILGDDPRIPPGRGKPHPDMYLLALSSINACLPPHEKPITPQECLVFEDAVPGVEAARRAGMRVVWVPHKGLREEYRGREEEVLAGRTGEASGAEPLHHHDYDTATEADAEAVAAKEALARERQRQFEEEDACFTSYVGDGWGELRETLEGFDFARYGIVVPPPEVDALPAMQAATATEADGTAAAAPEITSVDDKGATTATE